MLRSYKSSLLVLPAILLAGLYINTDVFADSNDVDFSITVNPSLTLALSSNTVNFSITPTAQGAYNSANFTVTSATNNAYGYILVMGTSNVDLTSNTINPTTGAKPTIPTLVETQDGISAADFEASTDSNVLNHYGVAIEANNFNAMKTTKQVKKTNANNASGVDTTTIALASKLDLNTVPGTYSTTINFQMTANPVPGGLEEAYQNADKTKATIGGKEYYAMQDMNSTICSNATVIGDVIEVYDARDNTIYHIGKLADNKCWLLDNLAIDLVNTSLADLKGKTNADDATLEYLKGVRTRDPATDPDGNYATAGVANWTSSYSYSEPLTDTSNKDIISSDAMDVAGSWKVGGYYNYCAASAGSYCYGNGTSMGTLSGDATEDICPSGWRMPTGEVTGDFVNLANSMNIELGEFDGHLVEIKGEPSYSDFRKTFHLPYSGDFFGGSASGFGNYTYIWLSNYGVEDIMQYLSMNNYSTRRSILVWTYDNGGWAPRGNSVRCIAQ